MSAPQCWQVESDDDGSGNEENSGQMSEYEKKIQQNVAERNKVFKLMVSEAKKDFITSLEHSSSKKHPPTTRKASKRKKEGISVDEQRRSGRNLLKKKLLITEPIHETEEIVTQSSQSVPKKSIGFVPMELEGEDGFYDNMITLLDQKMEILDSFKETRDFHDLIKNFSLSEKSVCKVVKSRICCMDWHSSTAKLLLSVGDEEGNIGFWDIENFDDKRRGVRCHGVHSKRPVNCLTFDRFIPTRLISSGSDGFVRSLDLNATNKTFEKVLSVKKDCNTAYHAQKDYSTIVVSQSNGEIFVVDSRASSRKASKTISCFSSSLNTVSVHPENTNHCLVCNERGESGIFDLRFPSSRTAELAVPIVSFPQCSKEITSAFFSPITGRYVLQTCMDHTLKLFDVQESQSQAKGIKSIEHNNSVKEWMTPFKANWHPQREDVILVGSMSDNPRRIELFCVPNGDLLHTFVGDWLNTVSSINEFHPSVPILAGGNAVGRVHVFRP